MEPQFLRNGSCSTPFCLFIRNPMFNCHLQKPCLQVSWFVFSVLQCSQGRQIIICGVVDKTWFTRVVCDVMMSVSLAYECQELSNKLEQSRKKTETS